MTTEIVTPMKLETPRLEERGPLLLAGFREHYTADTITNICQLWGRLAPFLGKIRGRVGGAAYGVVFCIGDGRGGFDYLAGVEVSDLAEVGGELTTVSVRAQQYKVFPHCGPVTTLKDTISAIWDTGLLSASGHAVEDADGPTMIEYYGEDFDPETGMGTIEVWVPIVS
jgi:AraC family transcriptional regulator